MPGEQRDFQCLTCFEIFDAEPPACNWCGEPVCFVCRTKELHKHPGLSPAETEKYLVGFCVACAKMKPLVVRKGKYRCEDCDYEWAPRVLRDVQSSGQYICPFCGALQTSVVFPFYCGRCAMELR
jgi:hypothetical protein